MTAQNQKYHKAELILVDGNQSKKGYAKVPDIGHKKVSFKTNNTTDNFDEIPSDDIKTIIFTTESGKKYVLERAKSRNVYPRKSGEVWEKVSKKKGWYFLEEYSDKMSMYIAGDTFKIDKDDVFIMKSSGQKHFTGFGYYFKRPGEKYLTFIYHSSNTGPFMEKYFRKTASSYFGKYSKLSERIMNKEFKGDEVYDLYRAYLKL